jgi:hypothetical protein
MPDRGAAQGELPQEHLPQDRRLAVRSVTRKRTMLRLHCAEATASSMRLTNTHRVMSTAFFPQVEGGSRGIASAVDGKALARSSDLLDEEAGLPLPEPKWFSAREGLTTVAALRQACRAEGVSDHALMKDLEALEKVLTQADEENRRWSLRVDI